MVRADGRGVAGQGEERQVGGQAAVWEHTSWRHSVVWAVWVVRVVMVVVVVVE